MKLFRYLVVAKVAVFSNRGDFRQFRIAETLGEFRYRSYSSRAPYASRLTY